MAAYHNGPVLTARSPALEDVTQRFAHMSVGSQASTSSRSQPYPSSPQAQGLSAKVLAKFAEQRKIGEQWPKNPYPMKYDISVYRLADGSGTDKCLASVDSGDWQSRELSIRITDAAIDILDEVLRKPIAEESLKNWRGITAQNKENFFINVSLHTNDIPDFTRAKLADTRSEQARFPINPASKGVVLAIPKEKLQQIGLKVLSFDALGPEHTPGPILFDETTTRVKNLFLRTFYPEYTCMKWLVNSPLKLSVKRYDGAIKTFQLTSPISGLSCELSRRLIRQLGMDYHLVHSLFEGFIRDSRTPKDRVDFMLDIIQDGRLTEERMGILST